MMEEIHDFTGFYILNKKLIDSKHGWVHIFDTDYGAPTYVGDMYLNGKPLMLGENDCLPEMEGEEVSGTIAT